MTGGQFLLVALWFHVRGHEMQDWRQQIGAGVFIAAAMLNKPTLGVFGLLLMVHTALLGVPLRRVALHTAVAGAFAVGGLVLAILRCWWESDAIRGS